MPDLTLSLPTDSLALQPEPKIDYAPRQLLTPLPEPGHFLLVIDNSSLEVFTTCPKSADYKLVRRREAHARNAALTFGGAIHEGLEKFLWKQWAEQNFSEEKAFVTSCQAEQDAAIVSFFTNHPTPPDEYRTVTNALSVLSAYRQRASLPDYQWEIQSDDKGPIIERAFELPLGVIEVGTKMEDEQGEFYQPENITAPWFSLQERITLYNEFIASLPIEHQAKEKIPDSAYTDDNLPCIKVTHIHVAWSGRIDAIAKCNNAIRVIDHKTTSIAGDQFVQDFAISNQVLGYVWAAQQLWPELNPSAFCLNAIHFKKPTGTGSISNPGPRGGPAALNFFRAYFDYSPSRVQQWQENCLHIVSDFINSLIRNHFCRHTKWCFAKYGKCQYHDVCIQDNPAVRTAMLNSDMFKNVTWNPVAGR